MGSLNPDRQGFICFFTGAPAADQAISDSLEMLLNRGEHSRASMKGVVEVRDAPGQPAALTARMVKVLLEALGKQDKITRLYLHGHGSHRHQTIGGWSAKQVADLLGADVRVNRIRILGCRLANGDPLGQAAAAANEQLANSVDSFAGKLCLLLKKPGMEVHANYYYQGISEMGKGSSAVRHPKPHESEDRKENSTVVFTYEGNAVTRQWKKQVGRFEATQAAELLY
jgi:hypothetical protein